MSTDPATPDTTDKPGSDSSTTTVNEQITDSITQTNVSTLAGVPSMAMGNLMTAMGQALSNSSHNATAGQQHANLTGQAATIQNVNSLTSIGTAVVGRSAEGVVEKDTSST